MNAGNYMSRIKRLMHPGLLGEVGRQAARATRLLALGAALMLVSGAAAHATLIFTFDSSSCACGSNWGQVAVSQDPASNKVIDFTVTLNSPYQFHQTTGAVTQHPVFAVDINVLNVTFGNFKLSNVTTTKITQGGASGNVPNFGAFPYTLKASTNLSGVLTFTASVATGTLAPTNIISNGKAYMTADILDLMNKNTGNIAAEGPPVHTPEPVGLGLFGVALAGLAVVRRASRHRG